MFSQAQRSVGVSVLSKAFKQAGGEKKGQRKSDSNFDFVVDCPYPGAIGLGWDRGPRWGGSAAAFPR